MKVWVLQLGYRPDYQVQGIYATKELAEAAEADYWSDPHMQTHRDNESWATSVFEMEVQGSNDAGAVTAPGTSP